MEGSENALDDVKLLNVKDVARLLSIHPRSVWRLAATGEIPPPIKLGTRTVRWRLSELKAHLDKLGKDAR